MLLNLKDLASLWSWFQPISYFKSIIQIEETAVKEIRKLKVHISKVNAACWWDKFLKPQKWRPKHMETTGEDLHAEQENWRPPWALTLTGPLHSWMISNI